MGYALGGNGKCCVHPISKDSSTGTRVTFFCRGTLKAGFYRTSDSVLVTVNPTGRRFFPRNHSVLVTVVRKDQSQDQSRRTIPPTNLIPGSSSSVCVTEVCLEYAFLPSRCNSVSVTRAKDGLPPRPALLRLRLCDRSI